MSLSLQSRVEYIVAGAVAEERGLDWLLSFREDVIESNEQAEAEGDNSMLEQIQIATWVASRRFCKLGIMGTDEESSLEELHLYTKERPSFVELNKDGTRDLVLDGVPLTVVGNIIDAEQNLLIHKDFFQYILSKLNPLEGVYGEDNGREISLYCLDEVKAKIQEYIYLYPKTGVGSYYDYESGFFVGVIGIEFVLKKLKKLIGNNSDEFWYDLIERLNMKEQRKKFSKMLKRIQDITKLSELLEFCKELLGVDFELERMSNRFGRSSSKANFREVYSLLEFEGFVQEVSDRMKGPSLL